MGISLKFKILITVTLCFYLSSSRLLAVNISPIIWNDDVPVAVIGNKALSLNAFNFQLNPKESKYQIYLNEKNKIINNIIFDNNLPEEEIRHLHLYVLSQINEINHHYLNIQLKMLSNIKHKKSPHPNDLEFFRLYTSVLTKYIDKALQVEQLKLAQIDKLKLSNELTIMSITHDSYNLFYKNIYLRKYFKRWLSKYQQASPELKALNYIKNLSSITNRAIIGQRYSDVMNNLDTKLEALDTYEKFVRDFKYPEIILKPRSVRYKSYFLLDKLTSNLQSILGSASKIFGNAVGEVRIRQGFLYKNTLINEELIKELRPLDILFEKTPFILTDRFIPGHFGHAAVWLGTKKQLEENGMWFHPKIIPLHDKIINGYNIIEALRPGVSLNTLESFLNIDYLLLARRGNMITKERLVQTYEKLLSNLGKEYDFNFDTLTPDKVVCSELISRSFLDINWPTSHLFGRFTISPDNIANLLFYQDTPLDFVNYFVGTSKKNYSTIGLKSLASDLNLIKIDNTYNTKTKQCHTIRKLKQPNQLKCHYEYSPLIY